jgi:hypothetical protein
VVRKRKAIATDRRFAERLFGIVAVWPTMMFGLIGALIIVLRCFQWLKTGVWETFTLHKVLEWCIGRTFSIDKSDSGFRGLAFRLRWF